MDYDTVVKCYLEMKFEGDYALDVSENLIDEIITSKDFSDSERSELLNNIHNWQNAAKPDRPEIMAELEKILKQKHNFNIEFAKFITHRLKGNSLRDY